MKVYSTCTSQVHGNVCVKTRVTCQIFKAKKKLILNSLLTAVAQCNYQNFLTIHVQCIKWSDWKNCWLTYKDGCLWEMVTQSSCTAAWVKQSALKNELAAVGLISMKYMYGYRRFFFKTQWPYSVNPLNHYLFISG